MSDLAPPFQLYAGVPVKFSWGKDTLTGRVDNTLVSVRTDTGLYLVPVEKLQPDLADWPEELPDEGRKTS